MTFDPDMLRAFWLAEYAPEMMQQESGRMPSLDLIASRLGGTVRAEALPIPADCADGFAEAYFGRPEALLDERVRRSQSAWGFIDPATERRSVEALRRALDDGSWDARFAGLRAAPEYWGSLRLVISEPD